MLATETAVLLKKEIASAKSVCEEIIQLLSSNCDLTKELCSKPTSWELLGTEKLGIIHVILELNMNKMSSSDAISSLKEICIQLDKADSMFSSK